MYICTKISSFSYIESFHFLLFLFYRSRSAN